jgi:hypothetical protein
MTTEHKQTLECGSVVKVVKEALVDAGYKLAPRYYTRSLAKLYEQPEKIACVMLLLGKSTEADAIKGTLEIIEDVEDDCPVKDGLIFINARHSQSKVYIKNLFCLDVLLWERKVK